MKKILVVDDNEDMVFSIIDGLKSVSSEYTFVKAYGGKEALAKLKKEQVDIVLLDIMMPDMDGWAVVAKMKKNPALEPIPLIFLTAKTDDLSKGMGFLTVDEYVTKPFNIADLNNRIKKLLKI